LIWIKDQSGLPFFVSATPSAPSGACEVSVTRDLPPFPDLSAFLRLLERRGELLRIDHPVSVVHEMTAVHRHVLAEDGPALLFTRPLRADGKESPIPVLVNLFGTTRRVAWGLGVEPEHLDRLAAELLALRTPSAPQTLREWREGLGLARTALRLRPRLTGEAEQSTVREGEAVDLGLLPAQICWPGEPAPLITWPVVITRPPASVALRAHNLGVYRMQILDRRRAILRWLPQRGGARHHAAWMASGHAMPVAVAIGADPALLLSAAMPLPEGLSEYELAALLAGERLVLREGQGGLLVPGRAEILLEGKVLPGAQAAEGPYGDHTGYYNDVESFPVLEVSRMTIAPRARYLSTFTGKPPDEPSRIGEVFNRFLLPFARQYWPELRDLHLPPEACSYRIAIAAIAKTYPGQARRVMLGLWSLLPQFLYTKLIIVTDADIDIRSWAEVMWAVATRADWGRDTLLIPDTPVDYLDFASPKAGLGAKFGIDATLKIPPETDRPQGRPLVMTEALEAQAAALWAEIRKKGPGDGGHARGG